MKTLGETDAGEFRAAISALMPQMRGFARFLTRDAARADDLVQESLLRALEHEAAWEPGTNLRAWIFRILRNAFLDQTRRGGVERRVLGRLPQAATQPARQTGAMEVIELGTAIGDLPAAQREALLLVSALEFSVAEVAAITGVPEGTVKARVSRARAELVRRLRPPGHDG